MKLIARFTILFLFLLFNQCISILRISEPADKLEIQNQGIVAFGIYYYDPSDNSLLSREKGKIYPVDVLNLFVVGTVDDKQKAVSEGEFINKVDHVTKDGMKRYVYSSHHKIGPLFVFRSYNPKVKYSIRDITYRIKCGDNCGREISFRLPPYFSQKALQFSSPPGQITFAGIYKIKKVILKDGGFFNINEESGYVIEDGLPEILEANSIGLNKQFFQEEEHSLKGAEISFLKNFIRQQGSGHWTEKAQARLKVLENTK